MTWCWWCCHTIEGETLELPFKYDPMRNKFCTMGAFCSWSCMKAFNIDKNGVNNGGIIGGNIVVMRKKLYGSIGPVRTAPYRYLLKEFGGPMTIEEFRKGSVIEMGPRRVDPSVEATHHRTEAEPRIQMSMQAVKMSEISNSSGVNEPLRLKRNKPLKRDDNNLEKSLGIIRKNPSKTVVCS